MLKNNPFTLLGPKSRKAVYAVFGLLALAIGAVDVWYGDADPDWLNRAQNVLNYLAIPVGALAVSNTPASPVEIVEKAEEIVAEQDLVLDDELLRADVVEGEDDYDPNRPL